MGACVAGVEFFWPVGALGECDPWWNHGLSVFLVLFEGDTRWIIFSFSWGFEKGEGVSVFGACVAGVKFFWPVGAFGNEICGGTAG